MAFDVEKYRAVFSELEALDSLGVKLGVAEVTAFEKCVNGRFSEAYLQFLTHVGSSWGMLISPERGIDYAAQLGFDFAEDFPFDELTTESLLDRDSHDEGIQIDRVVGGLLPISEYSLFLGEKKFTGDTCDCLAVSGPEPGKIWSYRAGRWIPATFNIDDKRVHLDFEGFLEAIRFITWV